MAHVTGSSLAYAHPGGDLLFDQRLVWAKLSGQNRVFDGNIGRLAVARYFVYTHWL